MFGFQGSDAARIDQSARRVRERRYAVSSSFFHHI
jgi:hypothetical protein